MKGYARMMVVVAAGAVGACSFEPQVSYEADVKPVIDRRCVSCHMPGGAGVESSGLALDSYEGLMKGTKFGPVVKPGDSLTSALNMLVEGRADPSIRMPHNEADALSEEEVTVLKLWVDQGAKNN